MRDNVYTLDTKKKKVKTLTDILSDLGLGVRYNKFLKRVESVSECFCGMELVGGSENVLSRMNLAILSEVLLKKGYKKVSLTDLESSVLVLASKHIYHPILDYFEGLKGVRYEPGQVARYFTRYFGVEDNDFTRSVSELFFVSAIKRIKYPGIKYDFMIILNGAQGIGKSYGLELLAGSDWYTDITLSEFTDTKIRMEKTRGVWIVEGAELIGYKQSTLDALKAALTARIDQHRMAYGVYKEIMEREYTLIGTTNNRNFLRSKERRLIILLCHSSQESAMERLEEIKRKRDQLWAEALTLEPQYKDLSLSQKNFSYNMESQNEYLYSDDFTEEVVAYVTTTEKEVIFNEDIWVQLGIQDLVKKQAFSKKLSNVMGTLGFENIRQNRRRCWVRKK